MREFMNITGALADETRVRTLLALRKGELCVCQITELFGLAPSTVSKHLSLLFQAGLVDELSLLITPVADGRIGEPALFDTEGHRGPKALTNVRILSVRKAGGGMFWLKARPLNRG